ncbi:SGNH/GDSL hydrolase family protein [Streptomyces oceani]|uniref:G-D-S-L family lipolytic protein n=1 Tax=Streptomyces oceani TaxID=1075402 RepID=A0A1E7KJT2_9ACTN|nr:SGNH/GDSL hydrolase family protein [Streptomyces oceani]OEV04262.1 G-D-S-L family lipolytic protein [Streptomyces oceani]
MRGRLWSILVTATLLSTAVPSLAFAEAEDATTPTRPTSGPASASVEPRPLPWYFDNRAVSTDPGADGSGGGSTHADFDGAGNSLSARDLRAAGWRPGRVLGIDAARLRWPDRSPGEADNVIANGQHVALPGRGDAVSFLVAATAPGNPGTAVTGSGTLHYQGGGSAAFRLRAPDWRAGPLSTKSVALPHLNTGGGGQRAERVKLYTVTVPADQDRTIRSVTLPRDPGPEADLHVFAMSVREGAPGWTGSWSASTAGYTDLGRWRDQTMRLVVHTSVGGPRARIRLANTFAATPVEIGAASIAVRSEGASAARAPVPLRFDGREGATVPAGTQVFSDPVGFEVPEDTDLLVSIHLPGEVRAAPVHSEAMQTSYLTEDGSGDRTGARDGAAYTRTLETWPLLTGVDVRGGPGSVVTLGDSITDGVGSTSGANNRWPDVLADRLLNQPTRDDTSEPVPEYGVLNQGISANRIVTDRYPGGGISADTGGVSAQHRLERDVLAQTGARTVVLFEGVNDVRWGTTAAEVIAGMRSIADRARERGLRVVAATIAPCGGFPDCTAEVDERRRTVNAFVRDSGGTFDAVLDFDRVLRDPNQPGRLLPAYDSGDHLHPGDTGLRALGESIDLRQLVPAG